jgi:predicted phosphodiesterase
MKLLVLSDLHDDSAGILAVQRFLHSRSIEVDAVICPGDLSTLDTSAPFDATVNAEYERRANGILDDMAQLNSRVFYIPGALASVRAISDC